MARELYKIVGYFEDKKITLEVVNGEADAERERVRFAKSFSSSWKVQIEKISEVL